MLAKLFRRPAAARQLPLHLRRGLSAEDFAAQHLKRLGWRILGRRIRTASGSDIDILAVDGPHLVFVEVRSRQADAQINALQSIREKKRRQLLANVRYILRKRKLTLLRPRIDIFLIELDADRIATFHLRQSDLPCPTNS